VKTEPAKPPSDKGDQVVTGGDLAFMNDAAPGGMAEVELGRMAAKQAQSSEVKQFAARMIADHTKAGDGLKQLAQQKKVILPSPGMT
jgi:putative membrane protein